MALVGTIPPHLREPLVPRTAPSPKQQLLRLSAYQMVRLRRLKLVTFAYNRLSREFPSFFGSLPNSSTCIWVAMNFRVL
ncbi:hypothetical protein PS2_036528 [Malus domestica]